MIRGGAINGNSRAGRVVCNHPAERGARTGSHVRPETESVWIQKRVELVQNDSGADAHSASLNVELRDLPVVTRKIDDQSFADGTAGETCSRTPWGDRNVGVRRRSNNGAGFRRRFRKRGSCRLDLVNGRVSRVELPRQVIKPDVTTALGEL